MLYHPCIGLEFHSNKGKATFPIINPNIDGDIFNQFASDDA